MPGYQKLKAQFTSLKSEKKTSFDSGKIMNNLSASWPSLRQEEKDFENSKSAAKSLLLFRRDNAHDSDCELESGTFFSALETINGKKAGLANISSKLIIIALCSV